MSSSLQVRVKHRIGMLALDVDFGVSAPWTVIFGPSGSGKSTILRAVAGLVRPEQGRIVLGDEVRGDQVLVDTETGTFVKAHRRGVRWASQSAALFPRMTVEQNLAFGGLGAEVEDALQRFRLGAFAKKRPAELSGGERQRVSVARAAIGARGKLLLLDEPFAGLDAAVRAELIEDLRGWLGETRMISVTHDVGEAFLLDAEVVKIGGGLVVEQGPVANVLKRERLDLLEILGHDISISDRGELCE